MTKEIRMTNGEGCDETTLSFPNGHIRHSTFVIPSSFGISTFVILIVATASASAQLLTYPNPQLTGVFPAGGQRGQTVAVELRGQEGVSGRETVIVDGLPGVTVEKVEAVGNQYVKATLKIAADAKLGRRTLRVASPRFGLSNFRYFFVGALPEVVETEPNNAPDVAHEVTLPVVINGRITPTLDVDCFRFQAKAGQHIVAAILAAGMDALQNHLQGYLDTSLELRDSSGKVLAAAEDSVGLDPLLEITIPSDGVYTLVVNSLNYQGSDFASYRLTVGDVPYPVAVFPAGGQLGQEVSVELAGANIPVKRRATIAVGRDGTLPLQHVAFDALTGTAFDLPFLRGEHPEATEIEPNDVRSAATPLTLPTTVNGRFLTATDEDWYRIVLRKDEGVRLEVTAQRFLGGPIDSLIEVFDATGKKLAENDDGAAFGQYVQCAHDFVSNDSWLAYQAPADGELFVRVRDLNGSSGPRSVYRLTIEPLRPDFLVYQWPDAVPIWGPGTTASFVVEVLKWGGLQNDIQVRIEGLPDGWKGSVTNWPMSWYGSWNGTGAVKLLLTITAPADAAIGTVAPFRVIGRTEVNGPAGKPEDKRVIEHEAQYMTLYGNSHNDRMHVRASPQARAVIAEPLDTWLETSITELTVIEGQTANIPIKIHRREKAPNQLGVVVNGPTPSAGCGWRAPITLTPDQSEVTVPLTIGPDWKAGDYGITVARSWASDIRSGRPGPCTPLIRLHVLPAKTAK
jgi:hypothetical protein